MHRTMSMIGLFSPPRTDAAAVRIANYLIIDKQRNLPSAESTCRFSDPPRRLRASLFQYVVMTSQRIFETI